LICNSKHFLQDDLPSLGAPLPHDCRQYSYTRDYSIVRDLEEKAILGKIDDLSAFEEILKEAPLPIEGEDGQSWVLWVVEEAIDMELLKTDAWELLGRVPKVETGESMPKIPPLCHI
jgi:hypothetical protein